MHLVLPGNKLAYSTLPLDVIFSIPIPTMQPSHVTKFSSSKIGLVKKMKKKLIWTDKRRLFQYKHMNITPNKQTNEIVVVHLLMLCMSESHRTNKNGIYYDMVHIQLNII